MSAAPAGDGAPARLRWQCRRGMLELDLLLAEFLERGYPRLTAAERADFARLLGHQDRLLQDWLLGQARPPDPALRALVERIVALRQRAAMHSPAEERP